MVKVTMYEAKTRLSRLGELAWEGEVVVITCAGKPSLRLEPYRERREKRKLGVLKGQVSMSPDFDEPDEQAVELFENSKIFPDED